MDIMQADWESKRYSEEAELEKSIISKLTAFPRKM